MCAFYTQKLKITYLRAHAHLLQQIESKSVGNVVMFTFSFTLCAVTLYPSVLTNMFNLLLFVQGF